MVAVSVNGTAEEACAFGSSVSAKAFVFGPPGVTVPPKAAPGWAGASVTFWTRTVRVTWPGGGGLKSFRMQTRCDSKPAGTCTWPPVYVSLTSQIAVPSGSGLIV